MSDSSTPPHAKFEYSKFEGAGLLYNVTVLVLLLALALTLAARVRQLDYDEVDHSQDKSQGSQVESTPSQQLYPDSKAIGNSVTSHTVHPHSFAVQTSDHPPFGVCHHDYNQTVNSVSSQKMDDLPDTKGGVTVVRSRSQEIASDSSENMFLPRALRVGDSTPLKRTGLTTDMSYLGEPSAHPLVTGASQVHITGGNFQEHNHNFTFHVGDNINMMMEQSGMGAHWVPLLQLVSGGAAYNSLERSPPPRCYPGTRLQILKSINRWTTAGPEAAKVLWLHGPAGAGKSAIAQTVAETCAQNRWLVGSFFFARSSSSRNQMKYLFPTLLSQISLAERNKRQFLDRVLGQHPHVIEQVDGTTSLLSELLSADVPVSGHPRVVIIDGLDECLGSDNQLCVLRSIFDLLDARQLPLKFLIVSRPEAHIHRGFKAHSVRVRTEVLSLLGDHGAYDDVSAFLRSEFNRISTSERHHETLEDISRPWPSDAALQRLVQMSGGYFVYAVTVVRFIDEEFHSCNDRLEQILSRSNFSSNNEDTPFAELDKLYIQILSTCPKDQISSLKHFLGFIAIHRRGPHITVDRVEKWSHLQAKKIRLSLRPIHSLLKLHDDQTDFVHASFGDFLLDYNRAGDYFIDRNTWIERAVREALQVTCTVLCKGKALGSLACQFPDWQGQWASFSDAMVLIYHFLPEHCTYGTLSMIRQTIDDNRLLDGLNDCLHQVKMRIIKLFVTLAKALRKATVASSPAPLVLQVQQLMDELILICDSALRSIGSPWDAEKNREFMEVMYAIETSEGIHLTPNSAMVAFFLDLQMNYALSVDYAVLSINNTTPGWAEYLQAFRSDHKRSEAFYHDRGRWNAVIATRCIQNMINPPLRFPMSRHVRTLDTFAYAVLYTYCNIRDATPGDERLIKSLQHLQSLPNSVLEQLLTKEMVNTIKEWLQKSPNPPKQMLVTWTRRASDGLDMTVKQRLESLMADKENEDIYFTCLLPFHGRDPYALDWALRIISRVK